MKRNRWARPKFPRGVGRPAIAGGYRADMAQRSARVLAKMEDASAASAVKSFGFVLNRIEA